MVADVRNTGRFSPETFDAEWLDGVTEPAVGARFRGHVKRNEIGPVYWTTCRVIACDPGRGSVSPCCWVTVQSTPGTTSSRQMAVGRM